MAKSNLKTASVLAFERKLSNSDGIMFAGEWKNRHSSSDWRSILIQSKDVRGTISNRLKATIAGDPAKLDAEIQKPNLQRVDVAYLPFDSDTLKLSFSLRVLGGIYQPAACNDQDYQSTLAEKIKAYISEQGLGVLASRYAENLANGRFLWRNRVGAENVETVIKLIRNKAIHKKWTFSGDAFNLRKFSSPTGDLKELSGFIQEGLTGDSFVLLHVEAFAQLGPGQEVFPSQELVLDAGRGNTKSKYLYQVDSVAAMHSQKIGNALRTIDTWYPGADDLGPIAVEPYGAVTSRGAAYRQPKDKLDFYSLLDGWIIKDKIPPIEQQHYVIAGLVRGGVFGEKAD